MKLNFFKISLIFTILLVILGVVFLINTPYVFTAIPLVDTILAGVKEGGRIAADLFAQFTAFWFFALTSFTLLGISIALLIWASGIGMYLGYGSLGYVFYDVGYHWVLGIVNMFFIIAFVVAALLYILDVEWGIVDKKTLPRLIIVAFLINFSSLFVKIIVDFFIIFERGVFHYLIPGGIEVALLPIAAQAGLNFLTIATIPYLLLKVGKKIMKKLAVLTIGATTIISSIGLILGAFAWILPIMLEIIGNLLLSVVFFIYAILFMARSFIIYTFLMLAPLAIAATVFPKTRSYFQDWLKQLILWGIMGTIIFFIFGLGLEMRHLIIERKIGEVLPGVLELSPIFIANFLFAIYALISLFMIKRFLPSAVQGFVGMLQTGAMAATVVAGGLAGKAALSTFGDTAEKALGGMARKIGIKEGGFMDDVVEGARGKIRTATEGARKKSKDQIKKSNENKNKEELTTTLKNAKESGNKIRQEAILELMTETGQELDEDELLGLGYTIDDIKKFYETPENLKKQRPDLYFSFKIKGGLEEIEALEKEKNKASEARRKEIDKEIAAKKSAISGRLETTESKYIQNLIKSNPELLKNKVLKDAISGMSENKISAFYQHNSELIKEACDDILSEAEPEELEKTILKNKSLFKMVANDPNSEIDPKLVNDILVGKDITQKDRKKFEKIVKGKKVEKTAMLAAEEGKRGEDLLRAIRSTVEEEIKDEDVKKIANEAIEKVEAAKKAEEIQEKNIDLYCENLEKEIEKMKAAGADSDEIKKAKERLGAARSLARKEFLEEAKETISSYTEQIKKVKEIPGTIKRGVKETPGRIKGGVKGVGTKIEEGIEKGKESIEKQRYIIEPDTYIDILSEIQNELSNEDITKIRPENTQKILENLGGEGENSIQKILEDLEREKENLSNAGANLEDAETIDTKIDAILKRKEAERELKEIQSRARAARALWEKYKKQKGEVVEPVEPPSPGGTEGELISEVKAEAETGAGAGVGVGETKKEEPSPKPEKTINKIAVEELPEQGFLHVKTESGSLYKFEITTEINADGNKEKFLMCIEGPETLKGRGGKIIGNSIEVGEQLYFGRNRIEGNRTSPLVEIKVLEEEDSIIETGVGAKETLEEMKKQLKRAADSADATKEYIDELEEDEKKIQEEINRLEKNKTSLERLGDRVSIAIKNRYNSRLKDEREKLVKIREKKESIEGLLNEEKAALNKLKEMIKRKEAEEGLND